MSKEFSCRVNFHGKTLALIGQANEILQEYAAQGFTLTLRQLYYQFVARQVIANDDKEYGRLGRTIVDARRAGLVNWGHIEDRTRELSASPHWETPAEILYSAATSYREDPWDCQGRRLEVWVEKAAPDFSNAGQTFESGIGGAKVGAGFGALFPAAGALIGKAVTPFAISPQRQALVDALRQAGITPTAGQTIGSKGLSKLEAVVSDIPFVGGGAEAAREQNNRTFTSALMSKAGLEGAPDASPAVLNAAHEKLGQQFDALGERNFVIGR